MFKTSHCQNVSFSLKRCDDRQVVRRVAVRARRSGIYKLVHDLEAFPSNACRLPKHQHNVVVKIVPLWKDIDRHFEC